MSVLKLLLLIATSKLDEAKSFVSFRYRLLELLHQNFVRSVLGEIQLIEAGMGSRQPIRAVASVYRELLRSSHPDQRAEPFKWDLRATCHKLKEPSQLFL